MAAQLRDAVNAQVTERVSTRSLGVPEGTDEDVVAEVPETLYTDDMRSLSEELRGEGFEVKYFTGSLQVKKGDNIFHPNGSRRQKNTDPGGRPKQSVRKIGEHEHAHGLSEIIREC